MPAPVHRYEVKKLTLSPCNLLEGRVAFITGGTSGIGLDIAKTFLSSGASVIITSRDKQRLDKTLKELNNGGDYQNRIFGVVMNNRDVDSFQSCVDNALLQISKTEERHIDILVNNAGVEGGGLANATQEQYDAVLDTNLKGLFFLSQLFGRYFKKNKIEANILNIASSSSLRPANSAYTISKWGVRGFTLGLAKSLLPYGITVNGLAPGPTATPMLSKNENDDISRPNSPFGRYILSQEVANIAVVLVSPMGRTIVGDIIYMTAGAGVTTYDDISYNF